MEYPTKIAKIPQRKKAKIRDKVDRIVPLSLGVGLSGSVI
jgi:hypothetical protein